MDRPGIMALCLGLWKGRDPILKERLYGLSSSEGNHGEDVKEYYFYLDNTPSHSYMKQLYKYPQAEFPYAWLVDENRSRTGQGPEFELLDTGVFDEDRYFDVYVEYAKASAEDICIRIEVCNRGDEAAEIHLVPQVWFRNTWAWGKVRGSMPMMQAGPSGTGYVSIESDDANADALPNLPFEYRVGKRYLYGPEGGELLFTNNETNSEKLYASPNISRYVKDAFHRHICDKEEGAVNPEQAGTKACFRYQRTVPAGGSEILLLRFTDRQMRSPLKDAAQVVADRKREADEFYELVHPPKASEDERRIQRQAPKSRYSIRNQHWLHLNSMRILSMPDKWEYPWFAAWDLAFHCVSIALIDPWFAKEDLWFMLFEQFQHPNGQIPAYEREFSDLNPPVHAWACWQVYRLEEQRTGKADREFLEKCFQKLLINFAWWINKVDSQGANVFEGGFLGLDNITVLDRSEELPDGAILEQSDATGWMGFFCLHLMRMALELAKENRVYEGMATKFFEHFVYIGAAMKKTGGAQLSALG